MGRKAIKKNKGRGKQTDGGGAVSQPHSKKLSCGIKCSTSQREINLAEIHLNSQGTILKLAKEIDTSVRHKLTLTFVVMHNK